MVTQTHIGVNPKLGGAMGKKIKVVAAVLSFGISELVIDLYKWDRKRAETLLAAPWKEFLQSTENFTKRMVVRTYGAKEQKRMEDEGSALLENGYAMQGQSGFAESGGTTVFSVVSANKSKGQTTITYIKQPTKAKVKGR
jgi:hypothetical protein